MPTLEQIRRVITDFQTRGEDKATKALDSVADAQARVATSGKTMSVVDDTVIKRKIALTASADKLRAKHDEEYRVLKLVAKEQLTLEMAMAKAQAQADDYASQITKLKVALGDLASGSAELQALEARHAAAQESADGYAKTIDLIHGRYRILSEAQIELNRQLEAEVGLRAKVAAAEKAMTGLGRAAAPASQRQAANERANDLLGNMGSRTAEAEAAAIDRLRQSYVALHSATAAYQKALRGIEQASWALSADEKAAAIDRETMAYYRQVAAIEASNRARQQANQALINDLLGVKDDFGGAARAADIAAYADELDRVRERHVPLERAANDYRRALDDVAKAAAAGALSESERSRAVDDATLSYHRQIQAIRSAEAARRSLAEVKLSGLGSAVAEESSRIAARERASSLLTGMGGSVLREQAAAVDAIRTSFDKAHAAAKRYQERLDEIERGKWALSNDQYISAIEEETRAYNGQIAAIQSVARARQQANQQRFNEVLGVKDDFNTEGRAADIAAYGEALERVRERYNPLIRAANDYRRAIEEINQAAAGGAFADEAEHAEAINRTTAAYDRQVKAIKQMEQGGKNIRLTTFELTNLAYQANDAATMLLSGSSAFQVFATQGGQVYQILAGSEGGLVGGLKETGKFLAGLVTPARLAGGAITAAAAVAVSAYSSWIASEKQLQVALQGRGRMTGASVAELMAIATAASDAGNVTVGAAMEITAAFAETGKIGTDLYAGLIEATNNYASVTKQELPAAAREIAAAFARPAQGADDLNEKLLFLDQATIRYIKDLVSSNRSHEAAALLLDRLNGSLPTASENLTWLGRRWKDVATFASQAYAAMGQTIDAAFVGPGIDKQIADAEKQLSALRSAKGGGRYGQNTASRDRGIVEQEALLNRLYAERDRNRKASAEAERVEAERAAAAIAGARDPRIRQLEELKQAYAGLTKAIEGGAANADDLKRAREGVVNQIGTIATGDMANGADTVNLIPAVQTLRKEQDLMLATITAITPAQRAAAAADQARYEALKRGASDSEAAQAAEAAAAQELAQAQTALTVAARDRLLAADESIRAQRLEIDLIGKTVGQIAELRANYEAEAALRREAVENGTAIDQAQLEAIRAKNRELGQTVELLAKANMWSDIAFDRDQIFRSDIDRQIASAQRSAGLPVDLDSAEAAAMRLNRQLEITQELGTSVFSDMVQGILDGESAADALVSALGRVADKLIEIAMQQLTTNLFAPLAGVFPGMSAGAGGTVGSMVGGAFVPTAGNPWAGLGFAAGGYTGAGGKYQVAGAVHKGEYVFSREATSRMGVSTLEAMHVGALKGYADGGYVGGGVPAGGERGSRGPTVNVSIHNAPAGMQAQAQVSTGTDGQIDIEVMLEEIEGRLAERIFNRRGSMVPAIETRFGISSMRGQSR